MIEGGSATNVVPDRCRIAGEVRSLDAARVERVATEIVDRLADAANDRAECDLDLNVERCSRATARAPRAPRSRSPRALRGCGYRAAPDRHRRRRRRQRRSRPPASPCSTSPTAPSATTSPASGSAPRRSRAILDVALALRRRGGSDGLLELLSGFEPIGSEAEWRGRSVTAGGSPSATPTAPRTRATRSGIRVRSGSSADDDEQVWLSASRARRRASTAVAGDPRGQARRPRREPLGCARSASSVEEIGKQAREWQEIDAFFPSARLLRRVREAVPAHATCAMRERWPAPDEDEHIEIVPWPLDRPRRGASPRRRTPRR